MKYVDLQKQKSIKAFQVEEPRGFLKVLPMLVIITTVFGVLFLFKDKIKSSFNPISIIANVAAADLESSDGRTNILILGSDRRKLGNGNESPLLTDTILVASIGNVDNDIVMISLPRDLWINDYYSKINAVYAVQGMRTLKEVVENVMGVPIHYHVLVTFELFEKAVDIISGVDVYVENSFTDYAYPIEGKENDSCGVSTDVGRDLEEEGTAPWYIWPCRYETVHFEEGLQTMDGPTALKYVRSRKGDNNEGTDFARAKRQQNVISAIKEKALSIETLINPAKLKGLYDIYVENVVTNIDFQTIQSFYLLSQQIDFEKMISVVLDDRSEADAGGLLYAPEDTTLYAGQYVLVPQTGNFDQIHAYIQKYIFGYKGN
ncbi:LCP family protein [Patescibacteria group bacterium]|nr:LCP family protein [Patescibacteria group bacterium]